MTGIVFKNIQIGGTVQSTKKRIALCLNGQPRFYEKGFDMFDKHLFAHYSVDVFCHLWWDSKCIGTSFEVAPWSRIKKPVVMDENCFSWISAHYKPKKIQADAPRTFTTFNKYPRTTSSTAPNNFFSKCYSQQQSIQLKEQYEKEMGFIYDVVVIGRYDLMIPSGLNLDLNDLSPRTIYNPKDNIHDKKFHVADHLLICDSDDAHTIGNIYDHIDECYQRGTLMNAEQIFTDYFKETGMYDRFIKYDIPYLEFFRK
jgi:hypothetical protein